MYRILSLAMVLRAALSRHAQHLFFQAWNVLMCLCQGILHSLAYFGSWMIFLFKLLEQAINKVLCCLHIYFIRLIILLLHFFIYWVLSIFIDRLHSTIRQALAPSLLLLVLIYNSLLRLDFAAFSAGVFLYRGRQRLLFLSMLVSLRVRWY